jgi:predicted enzyme related to lactoylglutathione lyase
MKTNSVSHFEIYGDDPDKLAKFYTSLFDWSIEAMPGMDYRLIRTVDTDANGRAVQPGGINGGMLRVPGFRPGAWVNYVNVKSVDESLARAQTLGAKVTKGKTPVPKMGWFAMMVDPQGNNFAIFQPHSQAK